MLAIVVHPDLHALAMDVLTTSVMAPSQLCPVRPMDILVADRADITLCYSLTRHKAILLVLVSSSTVTFVATGG
jgi:hypothetical protein